MNLNFFEESRKVELSSGRGTGRTTKQIRESPEGALFLCQNLHMVRYAKDIAARLERTDLCFESLSFLKADRWRGRRFPAVIVDHSCSNHMQSEDLEIVDILYEKNSINDVRNLRGV